MPKLFPSLRYGSIYFLILLCCIPELILSFEDLGVIDIPRLRQTAYEYGGFWPGLLGPWEPNYPLQSTTMFFTYALFHSGPSHLILNMITLFSLGKVVVDRVGQIGFLMIFVAAVFGGALGYGLLTNAPNPMVGASGGLFGLAGALLSWNYVDRFLGRERLTPVLQGLVALIALNLILWWLMDGHLAWETHLGGFICGWISATLIDPRARDMNATEDP